MRTFLFMYNGCMALGVVNTFLSIQDGGNRNQLYVASVAARKFFLLHIKHSHK